MIVIYRTKKLNVVVVVQNGAITMTERQWDACENNLTICKCTEISKVNDIIKNFEREATIYNVFHQFLGDDCQEMISKETNG